MIKIPDFKKMVIITSALVIMPSYFIYEAHSSSTMISDNSNTASGVDHKTVCTTVFGSECSSTTGQLCGTHESGGTTYFCRSGGSFDF